MKNNEILDGTVEKRLVNVEEGIKILDNKVTRLDSKLDTYGQVQYEVVEGVNALKREVTHQRVELEKWQSEVKRKMGGKWSFYGSTMGVVGWAIIMIYLWLHSN